MALDEDGQFLEARVKLERVRGHENAPIAGHRKKRRRRDSNAPARQGEILEEVQAEHTSLWEDVTKHVQADFGDPGEQIVQVDEHGLKLRTLSPSTVSSLLGKISNAQPAPPVIGAIVERRLKLEHDKSNFNYPKSRIDFGRNVTPLEENATGMPPPSAEIIDALYNIETTPFENTFLSRLQGTRALPYTVIAVDWETETPWVSLMNDIREHYAILHPDRERAPENIAAIMYTTLQPFHLQQVHDLLERAFWTGINVADSLDHSPEQCTVVAMYKRLVVGIAILSSPRETYITYLAVRAGWDNAGIARSMLYHLISMNPNKDITLHVSVNNPAMLLYNQFGFKAEEFVAGFYEEYLDRNSRASKNAFRLRLRQQ